ncbi:MAG: type II secretion system F family protein [Actinomycetota bacterium]
MTPRVLALAWAVLVGSIAFRFLHQVTIAHRARALRPARAHGPAVIIRVGGALARAPGVAIALGVLAAPIRHRRRSRRRDALTAELPFAVDLIGVAVGAGATPFGALQLAVMWSPPRIAAVLGEVDRACALGAPFDAALRRASHEEPVVAPLTQALRTAAQLGSPTAASLARIAADVRADVRRRAEAHARTVPVRLLFPLVLCLLPAFALLTVVPVLLDGIAR